MISTGLLWYDDDTQRPIALKIAEAAERYRERVGIEPTTCELSPAQTALATAAKQPPARRTRKALALPAITLRLEANDHLKPNYFLVGVAEGESPRPVRGWTALDTEPERLPTRRAGRGAQAMAAKRAVPVKAAATTAAAPEAPVSAPGKPAGRTHAKAVSVTSGTPTSAPPAVRAAATVGAERQPKPRRERQPDDAAPQAQGAPEARRTRRAAKVKLAAPTTQPAAESLQPAVRKTRRAPGAHDAQPAPRSRKRAAPMAAPAPVTATPMAPQTTRRANARPVAKTPTRAASSRTSVGKAPAASPTAQLPSSVSKTAHARGKAVPIADAPKAAPRAVRAAKWATATSVATPAPVKPPAARHKIAKVAEMTEPAVPAVARRKVVRRGEPEVAMKPTAATRASRAAKSTTAPDVRAIGTSRIARSKAPAATTPMKATKRSDKPADRPANRSATPRERTPARPAPQRSALARPSPRATPRTTPPAARSANGSASAAVTPPVPDTGQRTRSPRRTAARAVEGHTQAQLWDAPAAPVESIPGRRKRSA